ncbi:MAG: toprim domain-containing protein [Candidatus Pacebacteria bacterium]|nr:toprim domain-containing protein [Candidatus Paceibacterota bacterium]
MDGAIEKLAALFEEFPGIGRRQSKRFVYFLLHKNKAFSKDLTEKIEALKQEVSQCEECFRFFPKEKDHVLCSTCRERSSSTQVLIVEKDSDFNTIEKAGIYKGKYFILGGFIFDNEKKKSFARVDQLIQSVEQKLQNKKLDELIFALSLSPEGEYTRIRLQNILREKFPELSFSTLGRGLSSGVELEYSDSETLKYAFQSRLPQ